VRLYEKCLQKRGSLDKGWDIRDLSAKGKGFDKLLNKGSYEIDLEHYNAFLSVFLTFDYQSPAQH